MTKSIAGIAIPDSKLTNEAAALLREYGSPLLWNHSHRVFLFGSLLGREENLKYVVNDVHFTSFTTQPTQLTKQIGI